MNVKNRAGMYLCIIAVVLILSGGCENGRQDIPLNVPRGYVSSLEIERGDHIVQFGPFVGYYFRPQSPGDFSRLNFVTFNERRFYTLDLPENTKLFEGEAVRVDLEPAAFTLPRDDRINPVLFNDAPQKWVNNRPPPQNEFVHFHSCYDVEGPVLTGYWLKHVGVRQFTYDMGGRVEEGSVLFHRVSEGVDEEFAHILEFDRGPAL